jgi:hypothetical protein
MSAPIQPQGNSTNNIIHVVTPQMMQDEDIHVNVHQQLIITTEDKVLLCLQKHLESMNRRQAWVAPAGILVSLALTLLTANFKNAGLPANTWQALFVLSLVVCLGWLARSLLYLRSTSSIESVLRELKQGSYAPVPTQKQQDSN